MDRYKIWCDVIIHYHPNQGNQEPWEPHYARKNCMIRDIPTSREENAHNVVYIWNLYQRNVFLFFKLGTNSSAIILRSF